MRIQDRFLLNKNILGCSQAVRHGTLTPAFHRFESCHPSQYAPVAQMAEHSTFNRGVMSSSLIRCTNMAMSSSGKTPVCKTGTPQFESGHRLQYAPVAQMVEQRTFNPWVASSNLVRCTKYTLVVQWLEYLLDMQGVVGSSPIECTNICDISSVGRAPC